MNEKGRVRLVPTRAWLWRATALPLIVVLVVSGSAVGAGGPEPTEMPLPTEVTLFEGDEVRLLAGFNPKLDSALNQLLDLQRTEGVAEARAFAETRRMVLEGSSVQVLLATETAAVAALAQEVQRLGGQVQGDYEGWLQATVPIKALDHLAGRPDVQLIRDPWRAVDFS